MKFYQEITLKDGRSCILRNGVREDGEDALENFLLTHEQTDYLTSYRDENTMTPEAEGEFLQEKTDSKREIEILAVVDGKIAGCAGITAVGNRDKLRHRADFGISIDREYWGLGIGKALTEICIECAGKAGYEQLELEVVAENSAARSLYEKVGFREFARNPRGFKSRITGYQELISMRLELP